MTQAIIAFPPAEGIVECITMVHYYTATAEDGKILVVINTGEEMNPFLPLQWPLKLPSLLTISGSAI